MRVIALAAFYLLIAVSWAVTDVLVFACMIVLAAIFLGLGLKN